MPARFLDPSTGSLQNSTRRGQSSSISLKPISFFHSRSKKVSRSTRVAMLIASCVFVRL